MTEVQKKFVKELIKECNQRKTNTFDYSVEMWGLMWTPSYIYIQGESVRLSIDDITSSDFDFLVKEQLLEEIKCFHGKELNFPLEILRTTYQLLISEF